MNNTMNEFVTTMLRKHESLLKLAANVDKSNPERARLFAKADGMLIVIEDLQRDVTTSQDFLSGKLAGFEEAINILSKAAGDKDFIHASIVMALQNQIDTLREMVD